MLLKRVYLALVCVLYASNALADGLASRLEGTCKAPEGETNWTLTLSGGEGTWVTTGRRVADATFSYDVSKAVDGRVPLGLKDPREGGNILHLWIEPLDSGALLVANEKLKPVIVCSRETPSAQPRAEKREAFMTSLAGAWRDKRGETLSIGADGTVTGAPLTGSLSMVGVSNDSRIAYLKLTPTEGEANFYMAMLTGHGTSLRLERVGGEGDAGRFVRAFRVEPAAVVDTDALEAAVSRLPEKCVVYDPRTTSIVVKFTKDGTFEVQRSKGSFTPLVSEGDLLYAHYKTDGGAEEGVARLALLDAGDLHAELPSFGPNLCLVGDTAPETDAMKAQRKAFMASVQGEWTSYIARRPATVSFEDGRITYVGKEGQREGEMTFIGTGPGVAYVKIQDSERDQVFPARILYDETTGLMELHNLDEDDDERDGSFFEGKVRVRRAAP